LMDVPERRAVQTDPLTVPCSSKTGTTSDPVRCSWPDARKTPRVVSRPRKSAPAVRRLSGSRSPSVRFA
jgi:hypothetical protein